ncbi:hypothetical protein C8J57DRAFT_1640206 [Mycena rebaudengoi]|nr:hypothetical protein C8J57DRAFT_1640206 [Mycena rebaudengoi]
MYQQAYLQPQYQPMIIPQDLAPQTSVTAPHLQQYQPMLIPLQPRAPQLPTATQHIPAAGSYGSVKEVQLTLVEPGVVEAPAVKYQTAEDLYSDLQKVLFNWHPAFHFHGTFSIVADRTIHNADRARIVSRQLLAQTILYFQYSTSYCIMNLDVKTSYLPPYPVQSICDLPIHYDRRYITLHELQASADCLGAGRFYPPVLPRPAERDGLVFWTPVVLYGAKGDASAHMSEPRAFSFQTLLLVESSEFSESWFFLAYFLDDLKTQSLPILFSTGSDGRKVYFARLNGDGRTKKEKKRSQVHIVKEMMLGQFLFDEKYSNVLNGWECIAVNCVRWHGVGNVEKLEGALGGRWGDNAMFSQWFTSSQLILMEGALFCLEYLSDLSTGMTNIQTTLGWAGIFLALALKSRDKLSTMKAFRCLAQIFAAQGDDETALSLFTVSLDGLTFMDIHRWRADCMCRIAEIERKGEITNSIALWKAARPLFKRSSQTKDIARIDAKLVAVDSEMLEQKLQKLMELTVSECL